jgi:signal recognition particle receptor subunit beta
MAYIDAHTGELVLRIVYDGPAHAGKTTNVRLVHERVLAGREGVLESPGSEGRATEFFDFRDFAGGLLDGLRVCCLVLSVPGQVERHGRRRMLLKDADAVVFVADGAPERIVENRAMLRSLVSMIDPAETPLVLQINKADLLTERAERVVEALRLGPDTTWFTARAHEGTGVTDTFLGALRLATARARALRASGRLPVAALPRSADALMRYLHEQSEA